MNTNIPADQRCRYDNHIPLVVLEAQIELRLSEHQINVTTHDDRVLQQFDWDHRDQALWFAVLKLTRSVFEQACKRLGRDPNCLTSVALSSQADAIQRALNVLGLLVTSVGTQAFEQALQQLQGNVEGVEPHRCYQSSPRK